MKNLIFVLILFFTFNSVQATHLMGGEITWKCIKTGSEAGKYIFTVKVYRDCQGIPIGTSIDLTAHNVPTLNSINLIYIGANDLSPICDTIDGVNDAFSCGGTNIGSAGNGVGAVEEHIYQSEPILITGTPDSNGWHFTWSSTARNIAITNLANNTGSYGFTLRAVMYSFTDSLGAVYPNGNNCFDSSPKFYEIPRTILESGNGYDPLAFSNGFTYSHNAFDEERDSLRYDWSYPLDIGYDYLNPNSTAIQFETFSYPLAYDNPINGIMLDTETGKTFYDATHVGNFVTCTKVSAYNCGQLISEVYREVQVVITPPICNLGDTTGGNIGADTLCNVRPRVQPPFFFPLSSPQYLWDTIVHCGDTVSFDFIGNDYDLNPNGSKQDLQFSVSGGQFMNYNINPPALCDNPPCATFSETSTGASPPFITAGGSGSGSFEWITSCNHIISTCGNILKPSLYTFVIKVQDDFCPAPAIENTAQVISITVYPSCDNLNIPTVTTAAGCLMNNGTAQVSPFGGTAPYVSYWADMSGMPVAPNALEVGDYVIRVTDSTQCEAVDTITILGPNSLPSNILSATAVSCFGGNDGSIFSSQSSGQSPYSYFWSNGDTAQSISNLVTGTYVLSTYDANNCQAIDSLFVTEATQILPSITNDNGVLTGNATGGSTPYTYEFFGPNGSIVSSSNNFGNNLSINPIASGNYIFVVIDANGCTDSVNINFSTNFSPTVVVNLSNTYCDSLTDLTIMVSQDSGEVDISTALFQSNAGYFDIVSMTIGDTIGTAMMMSGGGSVNINTYLIVGSIISNSQAIIQPCSPVNGCLGSFTITNSAAGGIEMLSQSIPDGNNYTNGNMSAVTFNNVFVNPCIPLIFTSTINSELGDVDVQVINFSIVISSLDEIDAFNVLIHPNPSDGKVTLEMNNVIAGDYVIVIRNLLGQKVYDENVEIQDVYKANIDISNYGTGTYLISISNLEGRLTKKLIIE